MKLSYAGIQDRRAWEEAGVRLPSFDWKAMRAETEEHPTWVHFGAGNIFRGFIARLQQPLLEQGLVKGGIIAADTFDFDIMDQIYAPHDSMTLMVSLKPDGSMEREVVASIAEGLRAGRAYPQDLEKLRTIFRESITSIESAQNIVVVKTMPGLASAACAALDDMDIAFMVGSLAGDDTAFLVMKDTESALTFCEEIKEML